MTAAAEFRSQVGERLQRFRLAKHPSMGPKEFAEQAGLTETAYNNYEQGERLVPPLAMIKLRRTHGLSYQWAYEGEDGELEWRVVEALRKQKK